MTDFETDLMKSGFSAKELRYLHYSIGRYGSSLQDVVTELSNRFRIATTITVGATALLFVLLLLGHQQNMLAASVSLVIVPLIAWFSQQPIISYKAWRYRKAH